MLPSRAISNTMLYQGHVKTKPVVKTDYLGPCFTRTSILVIPIINPVQYTAALFLRAQSLLALAKNSLQLLHCTVIEYKLLHDCYKILFIT